MLRDLRGEQLRAEARLRFAWRSDIEKQIVSPDIDGLLSAALLHHLYGWPIVGFYDTERLWLSGDVSVPLDLKSTAWVDLDLVWPGSRCVSQHVTLHRPADADTITAFRDSVNPSILRRHNTESGSDYSTKYPFGTFQWLWWLHDLDPAAARLDEEVGNGLAWMPDGGFVSFAGRWRANCMSWAEQILTGSLMSHILQTERKDAPSRIDRDVRAAERYLRSATGITTPWVNSQWRFGPGSGDFRKQAAGEAQGLLDAITDFYHWNRVELPQRYVSFHGRVLSDHPSAMPSPLAGDHVVSRAGIGVRRFRWTLPDPERLDPSHGERSLREAFPEVTAGQR